MTVDEDECDLLTVTFFIVSNQQVIKFIISEFFQFKIINV